VRFTEKYGITPTAEDDWFDPLLFADSRIHPDPFRIYADEGTAWAGAHEELLDFFEMVLRLIEESRGDTSSLPWRCACRLLMFPEPEEFCMGYSQGSVDGSGTSTKLQATMLDGASKAADLHILRPEHMELLVLFGDGVGADRIGDIVCNVLKGRFIKYTQEVVRRHDVPVKEFRVRHGSWSRSFKRWDDGVFLLPENPFARHRRGGPLLLCPRRFLRDLPTVDPSDFWSWSWENYNQELRDSFNYDIATNLRMRETKRIARQRPDIAVAYLEQLEEEPKPAYDLEEDPKLVKSWEAGRDFANRNPLSFVPQTTHEFDEWVRSVVEAFAHGLKERGGWKVLWYKGRPRGENIVQEFFKSTAIHYCRANRIDLTPEANAGRGPVDFKFVQNWDARALIEVKLTNNSKYWDGLQKQTVQYLKSEELDTAYYVSVGYYDKDFEKDRMDRVREVAADVSKRSGRTIEPVFVDARPQPSASRL
jgi:hypothetical protein